MTVASRAGLFMSGEFLGTELEPDRPSKDDPTKVYPGRFKVKLLVGDRVYQVEYPNEDEALSRIGIGGWPERGDGLTVNVGVRSAKGFTFYFGRSE